jgi:Flp pilus assembly CpaE family ATPase
MRAGAGEFLERDATPEALIEAFSRFTASRGKGRTSSGRARIFTVMNSKGGAGGTTVAVNTAIALQETVGGVLLVDFAPLGHCALHLNVRPTLVVDACESAASMPPCRGLMKCKGGLQLLAGPTAGTTPAAAELARLFDLLVAHFRYVVVDCSGRVDQTARCCATTRMRSCWWPRRMWFRCGALAALRVSERGRHPRPRPVILNAQKIRCNKDVERPPLTSLEDSQ